MHLTTDTIHHKSVKLSSIFALGAKEKIIWVGLSWAAEEQIVKTGNVEHAKKHLMVPSVAKGDLLIMVTGMGYEKVSSCLSVMFFFRLQVFFKSFTSFTKQ